MTTDEAVKECKRWLGYLEQQRNKSIELQKLAALARSGPEGAQRAKREMRSIDKRSPTVYDAGRLEPAVRRLLTIVEGA